MMRSLVSPHSCFRPVDTSDQEAGLKGGGMYGMCHVCDVGDMGDVCGMVDV